MLGWAATFLAVAIIAAIFGYSGIALGAAGIAKVIFFVFLMVFFISVVMGLLTDHRVRSRA